MPFALAFATQDLLPSFLLNEASKKAAAASESRISGPCWESTSSISSSESSSSSTLIFFLGGGVRPVSESVPLYCRPEPDCEFTPLYVAPLVSVVSWSCMDLTLAVRLSTVFANSSLFAITIHRLLSQPNRIMFYEL